LAHEPVFGLHAALVTPFDATGGIDLARMATHARSVIERGCDGVTLFGTTGEGFGLSPAERRDAMAAVADALPAGAPIFAGVMDCGVASAADAARAAYEGGASGLLLAPPFFLKGVDPDGLFAWYDAVLERVGPQLRNVILYHIPGQTAVPITVDLVSRLRDAWPDAVTGVKDSSGDWTTTRAFLDAHGDLQILVGDERQLPRAMSAGAGGSICGVSNFLPGALRDIVHGGSDGRAVIELVDRIVARPIIPSIKALTAHVSGDPGFLRVRPPLCALPEATLSALVRDFDAAMAPA
jgi:4-hydroxy-tetrahydrodipicolinate synthase